MQGQDTSKLNMDALLEKYGTVQLEPKGYSMYPLFVPGRDQAIIACFDSDKTGKRYSIDQCKRGDVLLYRRADDMLVLHRVCRVKSDGFYMVGDNQEQIEGPLSKDMFLGILVGMVRKGKRFSVKNLLYRFYARLWLFLRPVRPCIKKPVAAIKKIIRKFTKK